MKKTLLSIALVLMSFGVTAQCDFPVDENGVSTGEGTGSGVPVPPTSCALNTGENAGDLEITEFAINPQEGYTFSLIVSTPTIDTEGNEENLIVGLTDNGVFDFSNDVVSGGAFDPGTYGFTSFVYQQDALDEITTLAATNPITAGIGFVGGETLGEVIGIVRTSAVVELLNGGPVTIEDFLFSILPLISDVLGTDPLCVDWATGDEVYNVEVVDNAADCTVGIEDITTNNTLSIYPNPASSMTNISFKSDVNGELQINLYDLAGKLVKSELAYVNAGENNIPVLTDDINSGVYLLQLNAGAESVTKRLTVAK